MSKLVFINIQFGSISPQLTTSLHSTQKVLNPNRKSHNDIRDFYGVICMWAF